MSSRPQPFAAAPKVMQDYLEFSTRVVESSRLEHNLLELVKIRASQINGCANCLNMHTSDARKAGETDQRLHLIAAWWDAPCYTDRERAAFAWTDHITLVAERRAPDEVYAELDAHFDKEEQVQLTMAIIVMNGWNRLAVGFDMFDTKRGW
ncbi:carboxymuconolactone decarboxylase family protein [Altererythrobacter fulvus]|uniref:carboxymuconolactone decarboxylase family protein n=1 Tax=Caenibius fulvus TaxID=2126012 RepID=UPI00301990DD